MYTVFQLRPRSLSCPRPNSVTRTHPSMMTSARTSCGGAASMSTWGTDAWPRSTLNITLDIPITRSRSFGKELQATSCEATAPSPTPKHSPHLFIYLSCFFSPSLSDQMASAAKRLSQVKDFIMGKTAGDQLPWDPDSTSFPTRENLPTIPGAPKDAAW